MGRQTEVLKTVTQMLVRLECTTKSYLAVFLYPFCFCGLWNSDNPILKNIMLLIIKIYIVSKKIISLRNISRHSSCLLRFYFHFSEDADISIRYF